MRHVARRPKRGCDRASCSRTLRKSSWLGRSVSALLPLALASGWPFRRSCVSTRLALCRVVSRHLSTQRGTLTCRCVWWRLGCSPVPVLSCSKHVRRRVHGRRSRLSVGEALWKSLVRAALSSSSLTIASCIPLLVSVLIRVCTSPRKRNKMQRIFLLEIVFRLYPCMLNLRSCQNQTLLVWKNTFLVLDLGTDIMADTSGDGCARASRATPLLLS